MTGGKQRSYSGSPASFHPRFMTCVHEKTLLQGVFGMH